MGRYTLKLATREHPFIIQVRKSWVTARVVEHQIQTEHEGFEHLFQPSVLPAMLWKTT